MERAGLGGRQGASDPHRRGEEMPGEEHPAGRPDAGRRQATVQAEATGAAGVPGPPAELRGRKAPAGPRGS